jgi:hypothetical protein
MHSSQHGLTTSSTKVQAGAAANTATFGQLHGNFYKLL